LFNDGKPLYIVRQRQEARKLSEGLSGQGDGRRGFLSSLGTSCAISLIGKKSEVLEVFISLKKINQD